MKTALSCLVSLALYLALAGALAFLVERRTGETKAALIAGAFAGLFAYGVFGNLFEAAKKLGEAVRLLRFLGAREPVDGERFVAIGPIEASGLESLVAPVTQSPAVIYHYQVTLRGRSWEGWGMSSCRIQSGAHSVRLLAFPELDFPQRRYRTDSARRKAEEHLRATTFASAGSFDLERSLFRDESGSLRRDVGPGEKPASLEGATLMEQAVLPGDVVSAAGVYSAARGGLVVDPTASRHSTTLTKGEPRPAPLVSAALGKLVSSAVLLAIITAVLVAFLAFFPLELAEDLHAGLQPSWLEVELESVLDERLRPLIVSAGIVPAAGWSPRASLKPGEAAGRIRTAAGELAVTRAAARSGESGYEIILYDRDRELARIATSPTLALRALDLAGASIAPASLPRSAATFTQLGRDDLGGRLSFVLPDGPAARIRFRANVEGGGKVESRK